MNTSLPYIEIWYIRPAVLAMSWLENFISNITWKEKY